MQFIPVEQNFKIANNESHYWARIEAGAFLYRGSKLPSDHL
jgi:hypothetical protein